ncbi:MAG: hypothetical protein R3E39_17950 [Anaerolineae bacterium]
MENQQNLPNYPDILGYITEGQQLTVGVVQAALALRPPLARAARPFSAIILLQNMSDSNVEVTVRLQLPSKDAGGKQSRFVARDNEANITLLPAEVGYLVMPVMILSDTTPSQSYRIGTDIVVEPLLKPRLIRQPDTGDEINLNYYFSLSEEAALRVIALRMLTFTAEKRGRTNILETELTVVPPKEMPPADSKSGWFSLWALGTDSDARPLLERFRGTLALQVLPSFDPVALYRILFPETKTRVSKVYRIHSVEVHYITKLLVYILQLAPKRPTMYHYPEESFYTVMKLLKKGWPTDGSPIPLPFWCRGLLHMIGMDEQVLENPSLAFQGALYLDLLRDGIIHGFRMVSLAAEREVGSESELREYADHVVQTLRRPKHPLNFSEIYLPLVLGGVTVAEDVRLPEEKPLDPLHKLIDVYKSRAEAERTPDNELIFQLTDEVLNWAVRRYKDWM